jgi:hypothetical protein
MMVEECNVFCYSVAASCFDSIPMYVTVFFDRIGKLLDSINHFFCFGFDFFRECQHFLSCFVYVIGNVLFAIVD